MLTDLSGENSPRDFADNVGHLVPTPTFKDLSDITKMEYLTDCNRPVVTKTHRDGVRMNSTAIRRETYIKNRIQKLNVNKK